MRVITSTAAAEHGGGDLAAEAEHTYAVTHVYTTKLCYPTMMSHHGNDHQFRRLSPSVEMPWACRGVSA